MTSNLPGRAARRPLRALAAFAFSLAAALAAASPAPAQDAPPEGPPAPPPIQLPQPPELKEGDVPLTIAPTKEGLTLLDLLDGVNKQVNRSVIFDSNIKKKIEAVKIQFVGNYSIPRSRMFDWLQGVLSFSQFILIPIGPEGAEQWMVVDLVNQAIRSRPTYVREEDLEAWKDRDGVYIVCTLRAKNLDQNDSQRARTAIHQLPTSSPNLFPLY